MDHNEAERKIGALKAIIQTLMPEFYWTPGDGGSKTTFFEQLECRDVIATAIANELTESEIDVAFGWNERAIGSADAEMRAHPLVPYLRPDQADRFREELDAII